MSYNEITQIQVECEICYDSIEDWFEDQYDADMAAQNCGWMTSVDITKPGGSEYFEHICNSCSEELHCCAWCEANVWCEDSMHCDDAYCAEECWSESHQEWGKSSPSASICPECEWENPFVGIEAESVGSWEL